MTSPDRETPPFETPPSYAALEHEESRGRHFEANFRENSCQMFESFYFVQQEGDIKNQPNLRSVCPGISVLNTHSPPKATVGFHDVDSRARD